ncbi:MAG: dTDP-4-dehydrorhamnose 3,5-epimerase [Desulfobacteraceae bacterium]|nr:MAG: dTDP-4-dehydrorhamnose 3,5-epimerase [Desulfobacteraceae bacterium]
MNLISTSLDGVLLIEPDLFHDSRGYFTEIYKKSGYNKSGIKRDFVQDNLSYSVKGVIRGLHFQVKHKQAKLIKVIRGEIFDVAVDLRPDSPNFGKWEGFILSDKNNREIFIPEDFAHGLCVLSETAYLLYKCSDYYYQGDEGGIIWSDPFLNINWPVRDPVVSEKDKKLPAFSEIFGKT